MKDDLDDRLVDEQLVERKEWAFCCFKCKCQLPSDKAVNSRIGYSIGLYHRLCCHNIRDENTLRKWRPPLERAREKVFLSTTGKDKEDATMDLVTSAFVQRRTNAAKKQQTKHHNDELMADPIGMLETSDAYKSDRCSYRKILQQRETLEKKPSVVVVSVFGGVGTALLALKRLHISIRRHVHVDWDKVATHVVRQNHDATYNTNIPDDFIEHVYFEQLEDFSVDIALQHGPIDMIIAGPPCQDFCGINASNQGVSGEQGKYIVMLASFIEELQRRQSHPLFFLVENVILRGVASAFVDQAFGRPAAEMDARYFSPTRRNRSYWCNLPVDDFYIQHQKANTFMASKSRVDDVCKDGRMVKIKSCGDNRFEKSTFTVVERERMLGFPEGYVDNAVDELFDTLFKDALSKMEITGNENDNWHESLNPKYHHFSGEHFDFTTQQRNIVLRIRPPRSGNSDSFEMLAAHQYSKRLLGNSFSVPVVEHLLSSLVPLFGSKTYQRLDTTGKMVPYSHRFKWEHSDEVVRPPWYMLIPNFAYVPDEPSASACNELKTKNDDIRATKRMMNGNPESGCKRPRCESTNSTNGDCDDDDSISSEISWISQEPGTIGFRQALDVD